MADVFLRRVAIRTTAPIPRLPTLTNTTRIILASMLTLPPLAACSAQDEAPPFSVAAGLFDQKKVRSRSAPRPVIGKDGAQVGGIIEQDPHFCDGRLHAVFHLRPGLILKPYYTDDPLGIGGWIGFPVRVSFFLP